MPRKAKGVENKIKEKNIVETTIGHTKKENIIVEASLARPKSNKSSKSSLEKRTTTKTASAKKTATKNVATRKTSTKKSNTKKATTKTTSTKKTATKTVRSKKAQIKENLEYYDLPYRYNETIVKILAQTPKKLFIYWDISDDDRNKYIENFGEDFFNNTVPVLIVHNDSQNYTFEVEINDFANCWYLDINDTKCKYTIELGRRSKFKNYSIPNNYIYVTSSNVIESPNDHILFEKQTKTVYFRNVKTNATHSKDIANISFIRNMGKIYNIYDAYKELYNKMYSDEDIIGNPASAEWRI